ncbi:hypothetical protein NKH18_39770 [Streptomyces sp. M10(2022)]
MPTWVAGDDQQTELLSREVRSGGRCAGDSPSAASAATSSPAG